MSALSSYITVLVALLLVAAPASAQILDANIGLQASDPSGPAVPGVSAATINITINYTCGGLFGTAEINVDPEVEGATASVSPSSFEAQTPPDCTVGSPADAVTAVVTIESSRDIPDGTGDVTSLIPVKVQVTGENVLRIEQSSDPDYAVAAVAGPYVEVTFAAETTEYEVPAGEVVPVTILVQSNSNTLVMIMPDLERPAGPPTWQRPSIFPLNVEPAVGGGDGSSAFQFEVKVPDAAPTGVYDLKFIVWAHSMGSVSLEHPPSDDPVVIPLTFKVDGVDPNANETNESPAVGAFLPISVLLGASLVAFLRRRD